ncbi:variable surface protein [Plasmodium gonderi]|uniref:Variable surface protein n=1 Tax=Plasmodium gonderi TaxID=77519 RepID=A0A1Y1JVT6_PLAGO|nr:variable surface protein [Plasmodium gonderi]GAW84473.1 variable surface protein [Plasmodium gonderi]
MLESSSENTNFDFNEIFPKCKYDFKEAINAHRGINNSLGLNHVCEKFSKLVGGNNSSPFVLPCSDLGRYLYHISLNTDSKKTSCKYFSYKLEEAIKYNNRNCNGVNNCYKYLINAKNEKLKNVLPMCEGSTIDIDNETYTIFNYLDKLYDAIYTIESTRGRSCWQREKDIYRPYISHLNSCKYSNDGTFRNMLLKLNEKYIKVCPNVNKFELFKFISNNIVSQTGVTNNTAVTRQAEISSEAAVTKQAKIERQEDVGIDVQMAGKLLRTSTELGTNSSIRKHFIILPFTILIIVLILYKYTTFGALVQSRVQKLKNVFFKNKNNEYRGIMDSHENIYRDKKNRRSYISYIPEVY